MILFYATIQKFRLLDCYTVICNSPGYDIKRVCYVLYLFSRKFISGCYDFLRKANDLNSMLNFLKSKTFMEIPFALKPVNKDLEYVYI